MAQLPGYLRRPASPAAEASGGDRPTSLLGILGALGPAPDARAAAGWPSSERRAAAGEPARPGASSGTP